MYEHGFVCNGVHSHAPITDHRKYASGSLQAPLYGSWPEFVMVALFPLKVVKHGPEKGIVNGKEMAVAIQQDESRPGADVWDGTQSSCSTF